MSSSVQLKNPALPTGSLVLVTGVSGFIASHIADQLLLAGYRVRGTVRDPAKRAWIKDLFQAKYGKDKFELVAVADMEKEGAFDEAVNSADGIIHTASDLSMSDDPEKVIPPAINGAVNALKAAAASASVKRFVLTSSSTAAYTPRVQGTPSRMVNGETWNEEAVAYVHGLSSMQKIPSPDPAVPDGYWVYSASKTLAEQAVWRWVKEHKPNLVVNSVLPDTNTGRSIDLKNQGHASTAGMVTAMFTTKSWDDEGAKMLSGLPPQWAVDVQDDARLHVAALVNPSVKGERLFGFAERFSWNSFLAIWRKQFPDRKFADDFKYTGSGWDETEVPKERADEVMREVGYDGLTTKIEDSLRWNVEDLV